MVDFLTSNLIMKKHGILLYRTLFTTDKTTSLLIHHLSDVTNTSHNYLPCEILARVLQAIHFYHKPCGIPHTIFTIYIYTSSICRVYCKGTELNFHCIVILIMVPHIKINILLMLMLKLKWSAGRKFSSF